MGHVLDSLRIRNFRMLEDFLVPSLGRVNLIVGRNNSGKSSVLEAIRILAARANPRVLLSILTDHNETAFVEAEQSPADEDAVFNAFRYLFPGRRFPATDDVVIELGTVDSNILTIDHWFYRTKTVDVQGVTTASPEKIPKRVSFSKEDSTGIDFAGNLDQTLWITSNANPDSPRSASLHFDWYNWTRRRHPAWDAGAFSETPCTLIPTGVMSQDDLSDLWDRVSTTSFEDRVLEAMRLIEPRLRRLTFIKAGGVRRNAPGLKTPGSRMPVVTLEGSDERIPLNSMGDGMLRVLQLVLAILPAQGGFLLIDEFENGLYHGVQEDVWKLVFQLATELDIQVFATTHSQDCIKNFARAAKNHSEEGMLFKMSRSRATSDAGKVIATLYTEEQLVLAADTDMEVR